MLLEGCPRDKRVSTQTVVMTDEVLGSVEHAISHCLNHSVDLKISKFLFAEPLAVGKASLDPLRSVQFRAIGTAM